MQRRDFLKYAGGLASLTMVDGTLAKILWIPSAHGTSVPVESLYDSLSSDQGLVLIPKDALYKETLISLNILKTISPAVRVLCKTPEAVSICIQWATANAVPFATRNGGHSYEGFSQSSGLVIDLRLMNKINLTSNADTAMVEGGARLGQVYTALSARQKAIPAGSCPSVGVSGHTTGGGYGLLARPFGLACDSLQAIEIVDAQGQILKASALQNQELFWACRGGGGGSFGVITKLQFKTSHVPEVTTFGVTWTANQRDAKKLLQAWQQWAPSSPTEITSLMRFTTNGNGTFTVRMVGQTTGSANALNKELTNNLLRVKKQDKYTYKSKPFIEAVKQFGGDMNAIPSVYMKGKSDYVNEVMGDEVMTTLFTQMPAGIAVIFDSYGGAIKKLSDQATAFAHRSKPIASIQYYAEWTNKSLTASRLSSMSTYYNSLRPYMPGSAYVNYCDLDLGDNYGRAYWGDNFERLIDVKTAYDPDNVFSHAQSIPTR